MTIVSLIERFVAVHGAELYDYSRCVYMGMHDPTMFGCRRCGEWFEQRPVVHLRGNGCSKCNKIAAQAKFALTLEQAVEKLEARGIFKYVSGSYVNQFSRFELICSKGSHVVSMRAGNAIIGKGCTFCTKNFKKDLPQVLAEFHEAHGTELYGYDEVEYRNAKLNVRILCRRCDRHFLQTPDAHRVGKGCPRCNPGNVSEPETAWLDSLRIPVEARNRTLTIDNERYRPDALVERTVYEFDGDYFHGNPRLYAADVWNDRCKATMGQLYQTMLDKRKAYEAAGYTVVSIWESDWKRQQKERNGVH